MATVTVQRSEIASPERSSEDGGDSASGRVAEYAGWVYHLGVNSIGHQYCHLRYLLLRGNRLYMYKRDPNENPGIVSNYLLFQLPFKLFQFIF
jgi:hypothetical protein